MTEKLYDADAYLFSFTAAVLSCDAVGDGYEAVLDRTCFFPEGGGQGADRGILGGLEVLHVRLSDGVIYHRLPAPLTPGTTVSGTVNAEERLRRMQDHTGEHIFSGLVDSHFGYANVGFHLGDREMTMDYDGELTPEQVADLEREANRIIWEDRKVTCVYPDAQTLAGMTYRSKKELTGAVRIVTVDGVDTCACCAPHVRSTAQVGMLVITDRVNWKGGVRLHARCGRDALAYLNELRRDESALSSLCSAPRGQIFPAAEKLTRERDELRERLTGLRRQTALDRVASCEKTDGDLCLFFDDADGNLLRDAALAAAEKCAGIALCVTGTDGALRYAAASLSPGLRERMKALASVLNGKGGGDDRVQQGRFACDASSVREQFKN